MILAIDPKEKSEGDYWWRVQDTLHRFLASDPKADDDPAIFVLKDALRRVILV
jgi:hypothetical protein